MVIYVRTTALRECACTNLVVSMPTVCREWKGYIFGLAWNFCLIGELDYCIENVVWKYLTFIL